MKALVFTKKVSEKILDSSSFFLSKPGSQKLPFVISSPHSGRCYPPEFQRMSRVSVAGLERSEDRFVDLLVRGVVDLGVPVLGANFPRSFVDLNRSPTDLDPQLISGISGVFVQETISEKVRQGLGVLPRLAANGAEIYDQLNTLLDMGHSSDQIRDLKKVKSILGQIPALEEQLQQFQRELRR